VGASGWFAPEPNAGGMPASPVLEIGRGRGPSPHPPGGLVPRRAGGQQAKATWTGKPSPLFPLSSLTATGGIQVELKRARLPVMAEASGAKAKVAIPSGWAPAPKALGNTLLGRPGILPAGNSSERTGPCGVPHHTKTCQYRSV